MNRVRKNSIAFCGGAFGDEGKGRIVDEYVSASAKKGPIIVYRDNGGANAGHTVEFKNGNRVALHQIPSGIFCPRATVILGKGMVIHPGDLITEIEQVNQITKSSERAKILIDEMAVLSLDTHRAYESVLKSWFDGYKGSTGRGISPAYADVILRQPLRVRDLKPFNREHFTKHYQLYESIIAGLGDMLAETLIPSLSSNTPHQVGSLDNFISKLNDQAEALSKIIKNVSEYLEKTWNNSHYSFVFEKAQALGLDARWGVYPDVSASDMTFEGVTSATEGIIHGKDIKTRAAVIKATYMSSVGTRKLPSMMTNKLADKIREDAHEYGATTKRPRDIAYLDLVALSYYANVGNVNAYVLTHMDIVYPNTPIKVCVGYTLKGKPVNYRPDQEFLNKVKPVYQELASWDRDAIQRAKNYQEIPKEAKEYLAFIAKSLGRPIIMITTGPKRNQGMKVKVKP